VRQLRARHHGHGKQRDLRPRHDAELRDDLGRGIRREVAVDERPGVAARLEHRRERHQRQRQRMVNKLHVLREAVGDTAGVGLAEERHWGATGCFDMTGKSLERHTY